MSTLRIGLLILDGIALDDVAPIRERLEALKHHVTMLAPSGSGILPVSGRYYPAGGGACRRKPLSETSSADFDILLIPDGCGPDQLLKYPHFAELARRQPGEPAESAIPIMSVSYLECLLDRKASLRGLRRDAATVLSGGRAHQ